MSEQDIIDYIGNEMCDCEWCTVTFDDYNPTLEVEDENGNLFEITVNQVKFRNHHKGKTKMNINNVSSQEIAEIIIKLNAPLGVISDDYISDIAETIAPKVLEDIKMTADNEYWNEDDVRLAVGRVLCDALGLIR